MELLLRITCRNVKLLNMSITELHSRGKLLLALTCTLVVLFCCLMFCVRIAHLEERPMHGDEANQAVRTGMLLEQGVYQYDPADHHGPVLYYAALPFCLASTRRFAETTELNFRRVPVFFSMLTLLLMFGLYRRDGKGLFYRPLGAVIAVALVGVSPAMNYYSRYFIQETLLVTFLTGVLVCAVRYVGTESKRAKMLYAAGLGASLGLALATKETVILSIVAGGVAVLLTCGFRRIRETWSWRDALIVVAGAGGVAFLFYSSFLTYPRGAYEAVFSTMGTYFNRATAVFEHQHPWSFYLQFLFGWRYGRGPLWSEVGVLLSVPILTAVLYPIAHMILTKVKPTQVKAPTRRMKWSLFVSIYTLVLTFLYSVIPYKTPWCVLTFLQGFLLLAAMGIDEIYNTLRASPTWRWRIKDLAVIILFLSVGLLLQAQFKQSRLACFKMQADIRNPYVYAHAGMDALKLVESIEQAALLKKGQGRYDTPIAIVAPLCDFWPLPWYLRKYQYVGYWAQVKEIPAEFKPEILVVYADQGDQAELCIGKNAQSNFFGLRPGTLMILFVRE